MEAMLMPNFIGGKHGGIKFVSGAEDVDIYQPERQGRGGIL